MSAGLQEVRKEKSYSFDSSNNVCFTSISRSIVHCVADLDPTLCNIMQLTDGVLQVCPWIIDDRRIFVEEKVNVLSKSKLFLKAVMRLFWMELCSLLMKHNRSVNRKVILRGRIIISVLISYLLTCCRDEVFLKRRIQLPSSDHRCITIWI